MLRCDRCGDTVIGNEGLQWIDTWFDQNLHAMAPERLLRRRTSRNMDSNDAG
jgi:hypothetical protein